MFSAIVAAMPRHIEVDAKGKVQKRGRLYAILSCGHRRVYRRRWMGRKTPVACPLCAGGTLPLQNWKPQMPHVHPRHKGQSSMMVGTAPMKLYSQKDDAHA